MVDLTKNKEFAQADVFVNWHRLDQTKYEVFVVVKLGKLSKEYKYSTLIESVPNEHIVGQVIDYVKSLVPASRYNVSLPEIGDVGDSQVYLRGLLPDDYGAMGWPSPDELGHYQ